MKLIDWQEEAKTAIGNILDEISACCENGQAQSEPFMVYFKSKKVVCIPPLFTHIPYAHCRVFL